MHEILDEGNIENLWAILGNVGKASNKVKSRSSQEDLDQNKSHILLKIIVDSDRYAQLTMLSHFTRQKQVQTMCYCVILFLAQNQIKKQKNETR